MAILERFNQKFLEKFKKKSPVDLEKYFSKQLCSHLHVKNRMEAINELITLLTKEKKLTDATAFYQKILAREKLTMTKVQQGIVVSHARHELIKEFFIAVGFVKNNDLLWDAEDSERIQLIFMIGGPENETAKYLRILSQLFGFIKNNYQELQFVQSYEELIEKIY